MESVDLELTMKLRAGDTSTEPAWAWLREIKAMIEDGGVASRDIQGGDNKYLIYVIYGGKRFFHASRQLLLVDILPLKSCP